MIGKYRRENSDRVFSSSACFLLNSDFFYPLWRQPVWWDPLNHFLDITCRIRPNIMICNISKSSWESCGTQKHTFSTDCMLWSIIFCLDKRLVLFEGFTFRDPSCISWSPAISVTFDWKYEISKLCNQSANRNV